MLTLSIERFCFSFSTGKISTMEQSPSKQLSDIDPCESSVALGGPKFVPPLYIQRYGFVRAVLQKHKVKSVVDLGSSQCKILTLLKTVSSLESISLVDQDKHLLEANQSCIKPLLYDFLQRRDRPLTVRVYHGDATQLDSRLVSCDAVSMVEFIEHLEEADLEKVVEVVFAEIHPKLVVITTPNAEFNKLFPNFSGMRHWDHKFEWTRKQFQTWCSVICGKYGYDVSYSGIGDPPPESRYLGHCSQAAIFSRTDDSSSSSVDVKGGHSYMLVAECNFPYEEKIFSAEEKLALEVQYYLHQLTLTSDPDEGEGHSVIPLQRLLDFRKIRNICDIDILRSYLRTQYALSDDGNSVFIPVEKNSDSDLVEEDEEEGHRSASVVTDSDRMCCVCEEEPWD